MQPPNGLKSRRRRTTCLDVGKSLRGPAHGARVSGEWLHCPPRSTTNFIHFHHLPPPLPVPLFSSVPFPPPPNLSSPGPGCHFPAAPSTRQAAWPFLGVNQSCPQPPLPFHLQHALTFPDTRGGRDGGGAALSSSSSARQSRHTALRASLLLSSALSCRHSASLTIKRNDCRYPPLLRVVSLE